MSKPNNKILQATSYKLQANNRTLPATSYQLPANKRNASALILTLVIVGLVASLAFFVGRSAVRETRISSSGSSSIAAYYAAEAGIEDGLARVAANRNIEVPTCSFGKTHANLATAVPCDSTDTLNFNKDLSIEDMAKAQPLAWPVRVRMARFGVNAALLNNDPNVTGGDADLNKVINPLVNPADPTKGVKTPEANEYVYDLKISSKTEFSGKNSGSPDFNPIDPGDDTTNKTSRSGDIKSFSYDLSGDNVPEKLQIYWKCNSVAGCDGNKDRIIIEYILVPVGCNPEQDPSCLIKHEEPLDKFSYDRKWDLPTFNSSTQSLYKVNIKPVSSNVNFEGVNFSIVAKKGVNTLVKTKSNTVKIQSIGYFGGVKRRLEAEVDKTSGSLLGLFDYAVFSGGSFTQP